MDEKFPAIGHIAYQWLQDYSQAIIQGITSAGIFLQLQDYRIIFITKNPDFGPVNVIVNQQIPFYWKSRDTLKIKIDSENLQFSHPSGEFNFSNYHIWKIPVAPIINISKDELVKRLKNSVSQFSTIKGQNGFTPYLQEIIKPRQRLHEFDPLFKHIIEIRNSLVRLDSSLFLYHAKALIGYGRGLTPSGDDLLCGILFLLNRWNFEKYTPNWIESVNLELLNQASSKTTSASSTLLYCAINGTADYRIQELADALVNDSIPFNLQAIKLARWGNSSGADFFAGLLICLQSIFELSEGEFTYVDN